MLQVNSRSVIRPEYLEENQNGITQRSDLMTFKRMNTNTAPVYWYDTPIRNRKRSLVRRQFNGSRSSQNLISNGCVNDFSEMGNQTIIKPEPFSTDDGTQESSYFLPLVHSSRYSSDSGRSQDRSHVKNVQNVSHVEFSQAKSYTHGQAEQLRRSRESTTFALIDSQLSVPPLNQVREMYLQNRCGTGSTSNSAARTTKKANLSVIHTVVRFRIKEHLLELLGHLNRSLDNLFTYLYDDYDPMNRDALASDMGIVGFPCLSNCQYCPDLFRKVEQCVVSRPEKPRIQHLRLANRPRVRNLIKTEPAKPRNAPNKIKLEEPVEKEIPANPFSIDDLPCDLNVFDDQLAAFNHKTLTSFSLTNNFILERPLPSYHNVYDGFPHKRVRLDSTSIRLANEFDGVDWSAEDFDFGPCGEELVDFHTSVQDSTPDLPSKCHEPFDHSYDLLHQFTNDNYSHVQLTINQ